MPGRQRAEQEKPFKDGKIMLDGLPVVAEVASEARDIEERRRAVREQFEQPGDLPRVTDPRDLRDVAGDDRGEVVSMPASGTCGRPPERLRISSRHHARCDAGNRNLVPA